MVTRPQQPGSGVDSHVPFTVVNSFGECEKERDMNEFRNVRVRVKNGMYFFSKKELPIVPVSCRNEDEKILYDTEKVATQCAESVLLFMEENEERKSPNIRKSSFYQQLVRGIDDPVLNGNDQDVWTSFDKPTEVKTYFIVPSQKPISFGHKLNISYDCTVIIGGCSFIVIRR